MTDPSSTACLSLPSQASRLSPHHYLHLRQKSAPIHRILFIGMGGSWLASKLLIDAFGDRIFVPRARCHDYHIPDRVNAYTLVIACSYSGNSDETLTAVHEAHDRHAHCICITSGWSLNERATTYHHDLITLPSWSTARRALGRSFVAHASCLIHYGLADITHEESTARWSFLEKHHDIISQQAHIITQTIASRTPVIYTPSTMESLGIRARQQLNENSKILCRHHHYPDANHNELMWWTAGGDHYAAIIINDPFNDSRNHIRMTIMDQWIRDQWWYSCRLTLHGTTRCERLRWGIWMWDRTSLFLAHAHNRDPLSMTWVEHFKRRLNDFVNKKDE